jgi:major membrane immunogen (membrane-anchored lipoprotein)
MKSLKGLMMIGGVLIVSFGLALGASTSTSSTVKDGKKVTTKVRTENDGTTTTTVTVKDKDGSVKTTTTVTDKDGRIVSTDDPEARAKAAASDKARQEKSAALANAPKRGPNDPIQAVLFQTVVSDDLRKATTKEGVFPYLRKEFENDPVIKPMDQKRVDRYAKDHDFRTGKYTQFSSFDHGAEFLPGDVYVETFAKIEDKVGINKATHKAASAPFLVYRAVIQSEYSDKTWEVEEEGFILQNQQVTKSFAAKIRDVILTQAGPGIPAQPEQFRRATAGMTKDQVNASEALQNLFKKKKKK